MYIKPGLRLKRKVYEYVCVLGVGAAIKIHTCFQYTHIHFSADSGPNLNFQKSIFCQWNASRRKTGERKSFFTPVSQNSYYF